MSNKENLEKQEIEVLERIEKSPLKNFVFTNNYEIHFEKSPKDEDFAKYVG